MNETKLLGTILTDDLKWNRNTENIVRGTNRRMQLLHKAKKFTNNTRDLKQIYMLQIRSKLDQSAVVWHSSLSNKNRNDLERVQKSAVRCILGEEYSGYENALGKLGLVTLEKRREQMCLKFAKQCLKLKKMEGLFPKNSSEHSMVKRNTEFFKVVKANTERFRKSAVPSLIRQLNDYQKKKKDILSKVDALSMPVNYVSCSPNHCDNKGLSVYVDLQIWHFRDQIPTLS